jgi:hypothetical protein
VYDFSGLSSEQVGELISRRRKGRLPRRLFRRLDGSVVLHDCPAFARRRVLTFALAVVLGAVAVSIDFQAILQVVDSVAGEEHDASVARD